MQSPSEKAREPTRAERDVLALRPEIFPPPPERDWEIPVGRDEKRERPTQQQKCNLTQISPTPLILEATVLRSHTDSD